MSLPLPDAPTIAHRLVERAAHQPDVTALTYRSDPDHVVELSYGELVGRAAHLAEHLRPTRPSAGGQRFVLIALPNETDYVVAFYACQLAGVTAITFLAPTMMTPRAAAAFGRRFGHVVRDCDPGTIVCHEDLAGWLRDDQAVTGVLAGRRVIVPERLGAPGGGTVPAPDVQGSALALLQYTSGSTSDPKGVMVTHRNLAHNVEVIARSFASREGEAMAGWLPLYHDMGLIGVLCQPLWAGMTVHLMPPQAFIRRPALWVQTISATRASETVAPNFGYDLVARRSRDEELVDVDLSCLRYAMNGAEPVRSSTIQAFAKRFHPYNFDSAAMMPVYGLAENTVAVSLSYRRQEPVVFSLDAHRLGKGRIVRRVPGQSSVDVVGCGVGGLHGIRTRIVDPDTLRLCDDGTVGEIWVSGPSVAAGYWGRPELTEQTFRARVEGDDAPYLRTGDLGAMAEGMLLIVGRVKDVIVRHGTNHYPQDLEHTAECSHPALRAGGGVAFSLHDDHQERVVLVQELERFDDGVDRDDVLSSIRRAVAEVHGLQLDAVALVSKGQVPKTTSGKVQRGAARRQWLDGQFTPVAEWRAA